MIFCYGITVQLNRIRPLSRLEHFQRWTLVAEQPDGGFVKKESFVIRECFVIREGFVIRESFVL